MCSRSLSLDNRTDTFLKPSTITLTTPAAIRLIEDILNRGLNIRIRVTGSSMIPFIRDGDIAIIRKVPHFLLKTGDLIFFKNHREIPTVHRIISKNQMADNLVAFVTKGDAMISFDEPIPSDKVLGKICSIERTDNAAGSKIINLESPLWRILNSAIALIQRIRSVFLLRAMSFIRHSVFVIQNRN